MLNYREAFT